MCQWVSGGFPGGSSVFLQIGVAEIALLALSCFAEDIRFRAPMFSEAEINTGFQLCSSIVTGSVGSTALGCTVDACRLERVLFVRTCFTVLFVRLYFGEDQAPRLRLHSQLHLV